MCNSDILLNRAQNYTKYCIQPNKMHKIGKNVHIYADLCNIKSFCNFTENGL